LIHINDRDNPSQRSARRLPKGTFDVPAELSPCGLVVLVAAVPLTRTLLHGIDSRPPVALLHRLYRDLSYIAIAGVCIVCFETVLTISLVVRRAGPTPPLLAVARASSRDLLRHLDLGQWFRGIPPAYAVPPVARAAAQCSLGRSLNFRRHGWFRRDHPLDSTPGLPLGDRDRGQRPGLRQGRFVLSAHLALV
jgi:hypothetical protein